jgi:putative acetyltransferase
VAIQIGFDDPRSQDVRALLATHLAFSRAATPAEFSFAMDSDDLTSPAVTFFSARHDARLVGIAALKQLDEVHAELKSMHTVETERRLGIARSLVEHIIGFARAAGYQRLSLETGSTGEFVGARALYARCGFTPCEPFAGYSSSAYNTFMTIDLGRDAIVR